MEAPHEGLLHTSERAVGSHASATTVWGQDQAEHHGTHIGNAFVHGSQYETNRTLLSSVGPGQVLQHSSGGIGYKDSDEKRPTAPVGSHAARAFLASGSEKSVAKCSHWPSLEMLSWTTPRRSTLSRISQQLPRGGPS